MGRKIVVLVDLFMCERLCLTTGSGIGTWSASFPEWILISLVILAASLTSFPTDYPFIKTALTGSAVGIMPPSLTGRRLRSSRSTCSSAAIRS